MVETTATDTTTTDAVETMPLALGKAAGLQGVVKVVNGMPTELHLVLDIGTPSYAVKNKDGIPTGNMMLATTRGGSSLFGGMTLSVNCYRPAKPGETVDGATVSGNADPTAILSF